MSMALVRDVNISSVVKAKTKTKDFTFKTKGSFHCVFTRLFLKTVHSFLRFRVVSK